MEGREALLTLAEFSLALAGFTGIVVTFGRREEDWHPIDSFRIQVVLWASIGPAFLSLMPIGLELLGVSGSALWRTSSLLFLLYTFVVLGVMIPRVRRLDADSYALLPPPARRLTVVVTILNLVAQVLNVLGVWFAPGPGVYFLGLVHLLLTAAFAFARTVLVRPRR